MHINPSSVPSQHKVFEHGIPALEKKKGVRKKKLNLLSPYYVPSSYLIWSPQQNCEAEICAYFTNIKRIKLRKLIIHCCKLHIGSQNYQVLISGTYKNLIWIKFLCD